MELPPSKLDRDDQDKYPLGPNGLARFCEDRIAELESAKAECRTRDERSPINKHLFTLRDLLRFAKSRAGYVETPADLGLLDHSVARLTEAFGGGEYRDEVVLIS